jgi:hypothetical protein
MSFDLDIKDLPDQGLETNVYPALEKGSEFLNKPICSPPVLIEGLLRVGEVAILSGESKSNKSWSAIQAGICIANSLTFWGMKTHSTRVLIVNTELQEATFHNRIQKVLSKIALTENKKANLDNVFIWNLRNQTLENDFFEALGRTIQENQIGLVILDPLYTLLGNRDENSNGQMVDLLSKLRMYCESAGAAALITHHFAKGNSATKNSIDRGSGAGSIARFADSMLTISRHTKADHFVLESSLRSFAPMNAIVLKWEWPLLMVVDGEDAKALKGGRPRKLQGSSILKHLKDGMIRSEWAKAVEKSGDGAFSTAGKVIKELIEDGYVEDRGGKLYHASVTQLNFPLNK